MKKNLQSKFESLMGFMIYRIIQGLSKQIFASTKPEGTLYILAVGWPLRTVVCQSSLSATIEMQWITVSNIFSVLYIHLGSWNYFRTSVMPRLLPIFLGREGKSHVLNSYYESGNALCAFTYPISLTTTPPAT